MDERNLRFVSILITFVLVNVPQGETIMCYTCTSFDGSGCGANFRPEMVDLVDCSLGPHTYDIYNRPTMCKKEITKTSDGIVIHRGCLTQREVEDHNSDEMCAPKPYNNDVVCRCDTDRCNDGVSQHHTSRLCFVSVLSSVLPGLLLLLFNRFE